MAVLRTRVTGPVLLPDGSAAPNGAKLIFTLRGWDKQDGALIMRGPQEAPVIDGAIDINLQRTAASDRQTLYDVSYTYFNAAIRNWDGEPLGSISLSGPGPFALADILALPAPVPNVPDALAQALGAAASSGADAVQTAADRAATQAAQAAAELYTPAYARDVQAAMDLPTVWSIGQLINARKGGVWEILSPLTTDYDMLHPVTGQKLKIHPVDGWFPIESLSPQGDMTDTLNRMLARATQSNPVRLAAGPGTLVEIAGRLHIPPYAQLDFGDLSTGARLVLSANGGVSQDGRSLLRAMILAQSASRNLPAFAIDSALNSAAPRYGTAGHPVPCRHSRRAAGWVYRRPPAGD